MHLGSAELRRQSRNRVDAALSADVRLWWSSGNRHTYAPASTGGPKVGAPFLPATRITGVLAACTEPELAHHRSSSEPLLYFLGTFSPN